MDHGFAQDDVQQRTREAAASLLNQPTVPFEIDANATVRDVLLRMAGTGFQGRNLGRALRSGRG